MGHQAKQPRRWPWIASTVFLGIVVIGNGITLHDAAKVQPPPVTSTVTVPAAVPAAAIPPPSDPLPAEEPSYSPSADPLPVETPDAPRVHLPRTPSGSSYTENRRNTHSGHLCRAGERDADSDGYCGEGR